jgi:hypothetical protein
MNRLVCPALLFLATALPCQTAALTEDFAGDPAARGWGIFGDASLFHWDATNQNLNVTWDSSRSNSYFYLALGNILARTDDFSLAFDLRLRDIRVGTTPGKSNEFEIAVGFLNQRSATATNFFRGAGVSANYGVRNLIEFDYFPDGGFGDTLATTAVSSNNVFSFAHNFPLTLGTGDLFRVTMSFTASDQTLRTTVTRNGAPFGPLADVALVDKPDFRVDAFAVISYSDAVQTGQPAFHGSVLAHGTIDNVTIMLPPPPINRLWISARDGGWTTRFLSRNDWFYVLERKAGMSAWNAASAPTRGNGSVLELNDADSGETATFYRVRAERP